MVPDLQGRWNIALILAMSAGIGRKRCRHFAGGEIRLQSFAEEPLDDWQVDVALPHARRLYRSRDPHLTKRVSKLPFSVNSPGEMR